MKELDIAYIWNFDLEFPDMIDLKLLEKVTIESTDLKAIAGMPTIKELTIYETGSGYSMAALKGMKSLESLTLDNYNEAPKPDMAEILSGLKRLKNLIIDDEALKDESDYHKIIQNLQERQISQ